MKIHSEALITDSQIEWIRHLATDRGDVGAVRICLLALHASHPTTREAARLICAEMEKTRENLPRPSDRPVA